MASADHVPEIQKNSPMTSADHVPEIPENSNGSKPSDSDGWLTTQMILAFQPVRPFYDSMKSSNKLIGSMLDVIESMSVQILALFAFLADPRWWVSANSNRMQEEPHTDVFVLEISNIMKFLYRIWFEARKNLRKSVDCIANSYEEVVPLLPGDEPWDSMDRESKSIRELCFVATTKLLCRILVYSKNLLEQSVAPFLCERSLKADK